MDQTDSERHGSQGLQNEIDEREQLAIDELNAGWDEEDDRMQVMAQAAAEDSWGLKRKNAMAGKGILAYDEEEEEQSDRDARPDLAEVFAEFDMTLDEQIRCCRAYASYLTTLMPSKKRRK